ncbi:MAG TPA: hypothetical protein VK728_00815 [Candidatus Sulfotelmatobacter sp.]|jgi:hypothetical protein|nr:hypothetical protein [Candidatus Sulfotelmatobacter sp.]
MDSDFLSSALNGDSGGDSGSNATPPAAPTLGPDTPYTPPPQGAGTAQGPIVVPTGSDTVAPPQPAGQTSVWKNVVMGALAGMAAGSGARGRNAGAAALGAGVGGAIQQQERTAANQAAVQFQSAQAAHMMVENSVRLHEDERASQEFQEKEAARQQNIADFLEANGIRPGTQFSASNPQDFHTQATGALPIVAAQNGGKIPPVAVISQPIGTGKNPDTHDISAYPITAQSIQTNPNGARKVVDAYLTASRGYPSSDTEWQTGLGALKANNVPSQGTEYKAQQVAAQQSAVATALRYFQRPNLPKTDAGKIDAGEVASMSATNRQELENYQKRPNADPQIVQLLQNKADSFDQLSNDALTKQGQLESQQIQATASAQAQSKALAVIAENTGAAGDAKANQAARIARVDQSIKSGNPADAGKMLADRVTTISELKSRGMTPGYIQQAIASAQTYDKNFNPVVEDNSAKVASSEANNVFFARVNSMVSPGGTIDQLKAVADKISKSDYQILNRTKNWADLQRGKGGISAYAAKAVGLADDYSSVMGSGVGSDASRNLALSIISPQLSPDQRTEALESVRDSVNSIKDARIGKNSFLQKMYGTMPAPTPAQPTTQPKNGNAFANIPGAVPTR